MTDYRYFDSTEEMLCEGWPLVFSGKWKWQSAMNDNCWMGKTFGPNQASNPTRWRLAPVEEQAEKHLELDEPLPSPFVQRLAERLDALEAHDTMNHSARILDLERRVGEHDELKSNVVYPQALEERIDALEAWRDGLGDRAPGDPPWSDPPQQEARREVWMHKDVQYEQKENKWWRECSPDDEGAVRFWREGE